MCVFFPHPPKKQTKITCRFDQKRCESSTPFVAMRWYLDKAGMKTGALAIDDRGHDSLDGLGGGFNFIFTPSWGRFPF